MGRKHDLLKRTRNSSFVAVLIDGGKAMQNLLLVTICNHDMKGKLGEAGTLPTSKGHQPCCPHRPTLLKWLSCRCLDQINTTDKLGSDKRSQPNGRSLRQKGSGWRWLLSCPDVVALGSEWHGYKGDHSPFGLILFKFLMAR